MLCQNESAQVWEQKPVLQQSGQTFHTVDPSTKKIVTKYNMYRFKGLAGGNAAKRVLKVTWIFLNN